MSKATPSLDAQLSITTSKGIEVGANTTYFESVGKNGKVIFAFFSLNAAAGVSSGDGSKELSVSLTISKVEWRNMITKVNIADTVTVLYYNKMQPSLQQLRDFDKFLGKKKETALWFLDK